MKISDFFCLSFVFILTSCVPVTIFQERSKLLDDYRNENSQLIEENEQLKVSLKESSVKFDQCVSDKEDMETEKKVLQRDYDDCQEKINQLNNKLNELEQSYQTLKNGSTAETQKLIDKLQRSQNNLLEKEDQLNRLSSELDEKKENLEKLRKELEQRNARLMELEKILSRKDSIVTALKKKVSEALLGFEGKGLTVNIRNGKVYVSLEEELLFKSGSTEIDARGVAALKQLAKLLEQNPDINIMVEGHTDDVPVIKGSKFEDNWDLSTLRATAVVRVILQNSNINPQRITASGRGEYMPIEKGKTPQARQKNRRTEIILTPKLDELFKILETN